MSDPATKLVMVGKTQSGQVITVSPHNHSILIDFLRGEHRDAFKEALSQIPKMGLSANNLIRDVNVVSAEHSIGMVYDDRQHLPRVWRKVTLADGRTAIVPFVEGVNPDFAQIKLHLQPFRRDLHLVKAVLRTEVLSRLPRSSSDPLCEYWRNNAFTEVPECMVEVNSKPVAAPSWS